jgi:hypothetical protein
MEDIGMETVFFLIIVGVGAFALIWVMRKSRPETDLAARHKPNRADRSNELLKTPPDSRLTHKEEMWEARRKLASQGFGARKRFVPKSEAARESQYDGYSRRHRHHLTANEHVKEAE